MFIIIINFNSGIVKHKNVHVNLDCLCREEEGDLLECCGTVLRLMSDHEQKRLPCYFLRVVHSGVTSLILFSLAGH